MQRSAGLNVPDLIVQKLAALSPEALDVLDESGKHIGHAGAIGGGGHYQVFIVSPRFTGRPLQARHRMIYEALGTLMQHEIHALAIKAYAPDEV